MIYLLYGTDEYRLRQKLNEIVGFLCFEKIDLSQVDEKVFWGYLNQSSLFAVKKLVVIENAFSSLEFKKSFSKKTKELSLSGHILIFIETKEIKPTDRFFATLKENGKVQQFFPLAGKNLEEWVKKLFAQFGSHITDKALKNLLECTGSDMWALSNEVKKLATFRKEITEEDVNLLVDPSIESEIFQTIDSLVSSNKKQAFIALQRFIDSGENLFHLLSMIAYQMRTLLIVKIAQSSDNFLAKDLGIHPYVFKKLTNMARNISLEQLKIAMQSIFLADLKRKTGQESPEQTVRSLVLSI